MAYILGFISADGNISKRKGRNRSFIFNITSKDRDHLQNIANCLGQDIKLGLKYSGSSKENICSYFQLCKLEICLDLINLGIIPRKTYSMVLPKVPKEYLSDYIRGFFDGDGSVYIYSVNNTPQIKSEFVCCSFKFITELNIKLCKSLGVPLKNVHVGNLNSEIKFPMYSICFYIDDSQKLAKFMYGNNPTLYLQRKRELFSKWLTIKRRGYKKANYPSKIK